MAILNVFSRLISNCLLPPHPQGRQHLTAAFGVRHSHMASATQRTEDRSDVHHFQPEAENAGLSSTALGIWKPW